MDQLWGSLPGPIEVPHYHSLVPGRTLGEASFTGFLVSQGYRALKGTAPLTKPLSQPDCPSEWSMSLGLLTPRVRTKDLVPLWSTLRAVEMFWWAVIYCIYRWAFVVRLLFRTRK